MVGLVVGLDVGTGVGLTVGFIVGLTAGAEDGIASGLIVELAVGRDRAMLGALAYFSIDLGACGRTLEWRTQFVRRIKEL
jgi:hypothetical protein